MTGKLKLSWQLLTHQECQGRAVVCCWCWSPPQSSHHLQLVILVSSKLMMEVRVNSTLPKGEIAGTGTTSGLKQCKALNEFI